ncbi:LysR family transcriptional regulator [Halomonas denitrificans]|uniref:LysR family transcriptional regulator n=2 Tax=Halomonas TaxID=2745 RepID=UPI001CD315EC|nr:LysR family transcriptional regulator [Halomonas denitrificans]MCA0975108.1 LysR family transcriptional regulator [Halomonas denitrificans]
MMASPDHKTLERMALFADVARTLSFTRAAEQSGVSKSYLSEQVRRLERDLNVSLLIRSTRSVRLTEDGERVLRRMDQVQDSLIELGRELEHAGGRLSGELRITAPVLFAEHYLMDICNDFQRTHPELRLHLDVSYRNHDLTRERFDLAFRSTLVPPERMIARPLMRYRAVCCAAPSYLARHGQPQSTAELREHRCLTFTQQQLWSFDSEDVTLEGCLSINDHRLLRRQALAGRGIVRVADYLVADDLARGELVEVLPTYAERTRTIQMIYPPRLRQSAKLRAFIEALSERLES